MVHWATRNSSLGYSDSIMSSLSATKPIKLKKNDSDDSDDVLFKNPGYGGEKSIGSVFRKVRVLDVNELDEFKQKELYTKVNDYVDKND